MTGAASAAEEKVERTTDSITKINFARTSNAIAHSFDWVLFYYN